MDRKTVSVSVGLFVILILIMTIVLVLFLNADGFSRRHGQRYQILFDSSIKGLNVGAPVTLQGVKIGEVVSIKTRVYHNFNSPTHQQLQKVLNVVTVNMYPGAISEQGNKDDQNVLATLMKQGLSAQIGLQSLLTGLLYIEVDFFDSEPEMQPVATQFPQIPTVPNNLEEFIDKFEGINLAEMASRVGEVLDNLAALTGDKRLHQLVDNVDKAFVSMESMSHEMSTSMSGIRREFAAISSDTNELTQLLKAEIPATTRELNQSMMQLQQALRSAEQTIAPDSPLVYQIIQSSKELSRASRSVDELANFLQQEPDAILFGRKGRGEK